MKLDKADALTTTETELLRDLRSRLGRATNDKAAAVLVNALVQTAAGEFLEWTTTRRDECGHVSSSGYAEARA